MITTLVINLVTIGAYAAMLAFRRRDRWLRVSIAGIISGAIGALGAWHVHREMADGLIDDLKVELVLVGVAIVAPFTSCCLFPFDHFRMMSPRRLGDRVNASGPKAIMIRLYLIALFLIPLVGMAWVAFTD